MKAGFLDKLIERMDRVEPGEVQGYLARLVREKGVFERVFEALEEGVLVMDAEGRVEFLRILIFGVIYILVILCLIRQLDCFMVVIM